MELATATGPSQPTNPKATADQPQGACSVRVGTRERRTMILAVRYVAANLHPDHDTICSFRQSQHGGDRGGIRVGVAAGS